MCRPLLEQKVVGGLVSVDYVRDQRPVKTRVAMPIFNPADIPVDVERSALTPNGEGSVIEHKGLAGVGNDAHVILTREWH